MWEIDRNSAEKADSVRRRVRATGGATPLKEASMDTGHDAAGSGKVGWLSRRRFLRTAVTTAAVVGT